MVSARSHDDAHAHSHDHVHGHTHHHGLAAPHPAQAITWSILRMAAVWRLAAAAAVAVVLWVIVWLVTRF